MWEADLQKKKKKKKDLNVEFLIYPAHFAPNMLAPQLAHPGNCAFEESPKMVSLSTGWTITVT